MGCLGVHFAITCDQLERLQSASCDSERDEIIEEIEEAWEEGFHFETDKSWDALHRSLTDGKLEWENGDYPLNHAVIGGKQLYESDGYTICLIAPDQVPEVAMALKDVTKEKLRTGYDRIDPSEYQGEISDEDFEYTWDWFRGLPEFFDQAAKNGRAVIFTSSQ